MIKFILITLLLLANSIDAQEKLVTSNGLVTFEASIPYFEPVEAKNEQVNCLLNTRRGTLYFLVFIKQFQFERALMEEHFNKNYLESDRYPKATFKGIIEKFDLKDITKNYKNYYLKGKLSVHGKSKNTRVLAKIKKSPKGIELTSKFSVNTDDFNIEIPLIVRSKISKKVTIELYTVLQ